MKRLTQLSLFAGLAILALPGNPALAQTQYTVRILATPGPYLGGNVSSINNGVAAGWAYTNCTGIPGCVSQEIPFSWPDSVTPVNLLFGGDNIQLSAQILAAQPGLLGGWETDGLAQHAILIDAGGKKDLNGIFNGSQVLALCPGYQAGLAQTAVLSSGGGSQRVIWHAMLWSGDANSFIDLHNQQDVSQVQACDGNVQVGFAGSGFQTHAVMWTGTRTSEIDLHSGASQSDQATAVSGNTQAGWGVFQDKQKNEFQHALIWHGAPNTLTDIHPAGFASSAIFAAAGDKQVGSGTMLTGPFNTVVNHGLLWFGTAASAIDLNQFLPPGYTDSLIDAIDPVTGIIAGAAKGSKGVYEPALWIPAAQ